GMPYDCSHLFIAIDVAHFCDLDSFRGAAAAAAERVRGGPRALGVAQLFTPGEPEWRRREASAGQVRLEAPVVAMLQRFAAELGVTASLFDVQSEQGAKEKHHA